MFTARRAFGRLRQRGRALPGTGKDVTTDPDVRGEVEQLAAALEATGRTFRVTTYYSSNDESLVSPRPRRDRDRDRDGARRRGRDQGCDRRRRARRRQPLRGDDHGRVHRRRRLAFAFEQGPEGRRAVLRPAGCADRAALRLRRRRRLARAAAAGDRLDRLRAGARRARRPGLGGLVLHRQHALGDGPRARGRLRALHRLPLPRGASARASRSSMRSPRPAGPRAARCSSAARRS